MNYDKNMSEQLTEISKKREKSLNIGFEDILSFFFKHLFSLIVIAFISGLLGYAYSYTYPKTYESKITLLPEYGGAKKGSSLALLAGGINSDGAEKLLPDLYPVILEGSLFGIYLLKQPVTDQNNHSYKTLELFLKSDSTKSFLSRFFPSSKNKEIILPVKLSDPNILSLSSSEYLSIQHALGLVKSAIDPKIGVITISSETKDPFVSSILVEAARKYLVNYVEEYRAAKAFQQAGLLKDQVGSAKVRLQKTEYSLQSYRDRNRNPFLNVARIEEQRLQSDYVLALSLHEDLIRRYEQALIKIKEEKPVFKTLEPARVPLLKNNPKRVRFFLISAFLGGFVALAYILLFKKKMMEPIMRSPVKIKVFERDSQYQ